MTKMESELRELAIALYDIDALKFGEFVTKSGLSTPIYLDLRVMVAYPKIMVRLAKALWRLAEDSADVSQICGVPYTALPLATLISVDCQMPMLIKRKEAKDYGTKKMVEGQFKTGDHCVIIEDVVTSGSSILETAQDLIREGLKVVEAFVVVDREQGGRKNLENHGIRMKSLYTISQLMAHLSKAGKVKPEIVASIAHYLKTTQAPLKLTQEPPNNKLSIDFSSRAKLTKNVLASKLFQLMEAKQSMICLAADLTRTDAILDLAKVAGPHIVMLKLHVDIIEDFNSDFIQRLKLMALKYDFLIMEDRKFADIGNTVSLQYGHGIYKIAEWADLITVHSVSGPSIIEGLQKALKTYNVTEPRGIFLIAEMSSKNASTVGEYVKNTISMGESSDLVAGFVCQSNVSTNPGLIQLTPGIQLSKSSDDLGQQYNTPEIVVNAGADIAVIGRGITEATDQLTAILKYKTELWAAYKRRIANQK